MKNVFVINFGKKISMDERKDSTYKQILYLPHAVPYKKKKRKKKVESYEQPSR